MKPRNPIETLADAPHEFGKHGGVNMSVEADTTFTVLQSRTMPEIFRRLKDPEQGCCRDFTGPGPDVAGNHRHTQATLATTGKHISSPTEI